jgi:hypothetical protein
MQTLRLTLISFFALLLTVSLGAASEQARSTRLSSLPTAAQSGISAALGRDIPEYYVQAGGDGLTSANPHQKLSTHFTREAVEVREGNARWRMTLRGYGYGEAVKVLDTVAPRVSLNRVEYRHGSLTEWYVNGPVGLEQGFTINAPPGNRNGQPLLIALAVSGNVTVADPGNDSLTLRRRDGTAALRYSGLTAHDAGGKELRAWLELRGQRLLLKVTDAAAQYPVEVDPWVQLAELTPSDGTYLDHFGESVSISGNTVAVGSDNGNASSVLYVFVKPASGWTNMTETARLTEANGTQGDGFGGWVSISGDTIVAGVPYATVGSNQQQGEALIFAKPAGGWKDMTETAKLTAADGEAFDNFGYAVAITGDTAVVGGYANANNDLGTAYAFVKPAGGWTDMTQTAKLTASDGQSVAVSLSVSSNIIAAGSLATIGSHFEQGAVYVFVKPSGGWVNMTQTAKLTASDGQAGDFLGLSVAVDAGGDTLIAGAPLVGGYAHPGAAYVFVRPAKGWADMTETARLARHCRTQGCPEKGVLGSSVSITPTGGSVFTGAPSLTVRTNRAQGAVFEFVKPQSGWQTTSTPSHEILASDGAAGDYFGTLSFSDGALAVGSYGYRANQGKGVVYMFGK